MLMGKILQKLSKYRRYKKSKNNRKLLAKETITVLKNFICKNRICKKNITKNIRT